jgi:hypothetical protein
LSLLIRTCTYKKLKLTLIPDIFEILLELHISGLETLSDLIYICERYRDAIPDGLPLSKKCLSACLEFPEAASNIASFYVACRQFIDCSSLLSRDILESRLEVDDLANLLSKIISHEERFEWEQLSAKELSEILFYRYPAKYGALLERLIEDSGSVKSSSRLLVTDKILLFIKGRLLDKESLTIEMLRIGTNFVTLRYFDDDPPLFLFQILSEPCFATPESFKFHERIAVSCLLTATVTAIPIQASSDSDREDILYAKVWRNTLAALLPSLLLWLKEHEKVTV